MNIFVEIFALFLLASASSVHCNVVENYEYMPGRCEALTIDFLATLVSKEARQLLLFEPRPLKSLRFDLYTRRNPYKRQVLKAGDDKSLKESNFNASWPIRLTIHGWNGHTFSCSNAAIKDAYLFKGDFNVILIDWSDYALDINYLRVVKEIFDIARKINEFTSFLHTQTGVAFKDMYLIGHSLGVHLTAAAGRLLKPNMYGVIYALDAAGPLYYDTQTPSRLTPDDAIYVESIQTDITLLGLPTSNLGHASFYPNWGLGQPHCPNTTTTESDFMCDHFGALYFFTESIRNNDAFGAIRCRNFKSIQQLKCSCENSEKYCKSKAFMGGEPAVPKRGVFYLSTRRSPPFGYGEMCYMKRALASTFKRLDSKQLSK